MITFLDNYEVFIGIIMLLLILCTCVYLFISIKRYIKYRKEQKRIQREIRIQMLKLALHKRGLKVLCDFLPNPNGTIPEEEKQ